MKIQKLGPAAILIACFVLLLYNSGSRFSMGLVLKPMSDALGWGRTSLSFTVTCFMIITAISLPLVGRLVDRYSPRRVLLTSIAISALGLSLMPLVSRPLEAFVFYGVLFAIGSAGTSITPVGVMLSRVYPGRIGIANSIAISGMGVGQLVVILLISNQLERLGWQGAFGLLAVIAIVILLPMIWLLMSGEVGDSPGQRGSADAEVQVPSALAEVLTSTRFLVIFSIYVICGFQDFFVATHVVALAIDLGNDLRFSGNLYAFMGLLGLIGVLGTGLLSDCFGPVLPTMFSFVLRILLFALMLLSNSAAAVMVFALLYGLTFWITAPLTVVFTRRLFGDQRLGTISGIITMGHHGAGGLGALVGGLWFDSQGSYAPAISLCLALSVISLLLCFYPRLRRDG